MKPLAFGCLAWISRKGQPFYRRPDALADLLIHGRQVQVKAYKHDRYGRLIGSLQIWTSVAAP